MENEDKVQELLETAEKVHKEEADRIIKEEEENKETKEYSKLEDFLGDPEQQDKARILAKQVQETVGRNWFDGRRYLRKTGRGAEEMRFQLGLLREFGHLVIKNEGKDQFYKIVFDTIDEQALIVKELEGLELRKKILKADLRRLKKKQKEIEKQDAKEGE